MFTSVFFNKNKVFVQEENDGFYVREYQDNVLNIIKLENERELVEEFFLDKKEEYEEFLEKDRKKIKSFILAVVIVFLNTLGIAMLGIVNLGLLLLFSSFLQGLILVIYSFVYRKSKRILDKLSLELKFLSEEQIDINKKIEILEKDKSNYKRIDDLDALNLVAFNTERRYLLNRKLELLEDYLENKRDYESNIDRVVNEELNSFVRKLINTK